MSSTASFIVCASSNRIAAMTTETFNLIVRTKCMISANNQKTKGMIIIMVLGHEGKTEIKGYFHENNKMGDFNLWNTLPSMHFRNH